MLGLFSPLRPQVRGHLLCHPVSKVLIPLIALFSHPISFVSQRVIISFLVFTWSGCRREALCLSHLGHGIGLAPARLCSCSVAKSCPTHCDPLGCSLPGSSVHGISQAGILEWVAISFSRGSSWIEPTSSASQLHS